MLERFTPPARQAVVDTQVTAMAAGAGTVGEEHLLEGLLRQPDCNAATLLVQCGCGPDDHAAVLQECRDFRRRGGIGRAEAEALRGLGIEVDEIIDRVEEIWGKDALLEAVPAEPAGRARRKRGAAVAGRSRLTWRTEAKRVLETSLRQALDLKSKTIGTEHILLALLIRDGVVREVLTARGITSLHVRSLIQSGSAPTEQG